jgi:hypothetical protein
MSTPALYSAALLFANVIADLGPRPSATFYLLLLFSTLQLAAERGVADHMFFAVTCPAPFTSLPGRAVNKHTTNTFNMTLSSFRLNYLTRLVQNGFARRKKSTWSSISDILKADGVSNEKLTVKVALNSEVSAHIV